MDQGERAFSRGAFDQAIASWTEAVRLCERESHTAGQCRALIRLSQAYHATGQHRQALKSLEAALELEKKPGTPDSCQSAATLGCLGNTYLGMGEVEIAFRYLNQGLAIARGSECSHITAIVLNNLGNLLVTQKRYDEALDAYRESADLADKTGNPSLGALALANGALALMRKGQYRDTASHLERTMDRMGALDDTYQKAYGFITVGLAYRDLRPELPDSERFLLRRAHEALTEALSVARKIGDPRSASYAYGYLGQLYEDEQRFPEALDLTRRAVFAAQQKNAAESLYRWQWQSGRILQHQGRIDESIAAYRRAVQTLQAIREEMSTCYGDPEASFSRTAGAVCSEMVDLLLQRAAMLTAGENPEPYLLEARETLELLKVFELRDYFKDDCVDAARFAETSLDVVSKTAVVIYPILLKDRMELLASFPGKVRRFGLPIGAARVSEEVMEFRRKLEKRTTNQFLPHAQKLYEWVIRPLEEELASTTVDTLVIVPDGAFRTIPLAALHDGERFLIQRYAVAITPGLNLTDPKPIDRGKARALSLGLTEQVQGFPGLPYVSSELKAINQLYGGDLLVNRDFLIANVERELRKEPFPIIHIASHSEFGGDAQETFLLAYDGKLTMNRLGQCVGLFKFREEPLDLLTLSACETAAGDERAALGLAGIAVRAGARSALATLWHINDPASYQLVVEFYQQLQDPSVSRASALRAAQLKMLEYPRYEHPGYWSPFLMINNWL